MRKSLIALVFSLFALPYSYSQSYDCEIANLVVVPGSADFSASFLNDHFQCTLIEHLCVYRIKEKPGQRGLGRDGYRFLILEENGLTAPKSFENTTVFDIPINPDNIGPYTFHLFILDEQGRYCAIFSIPAGELSCIDCGECEPEFNIVVDDVRCYQDTPAIGGAWYCEYDVHVEIDQVCDNITVEDILWNNGSRGAYPDNYTFGGTFNDFQNYICVDVELSAGCSYRYCEPFLCNSNECPDICTVDPAVPATIIAEQTDCDMDSLGNRTCFFKATLDPSYEDVTWNILFRYNNNQLSSYTLGTGDSIFFPVHDAGNISLIYLSALAYDSRGCFVGVPPKILRCNPRGCMSMPRAGLDEDQPLWESDDILGLTQELTLFPNPTLDGRLQIVSPDDLVGKTYRLSDAMGRAVRLGVLQKTTFMDLSDEPSGIFFLQVKGMDGHAYKVIRR